MENPPNTVFYCIYHKVKYTPTTNNLTFFGVNEIYPKERGDNTIFEYELEKYNPDLLDKKFLIAM